MTKLKKFIFIIDALKANKKDLISNILLDKFYSIDIIPPFTFEPDASYLSGKKPEEADSGLKYIKSNNTNNALILDLLNLIPNKPAIIRKSFNHVLKLININQLKRYKNNFGCIPFSLLKYYEISQKYNLFQRSSGAPFQTIFDLIKENYYYIGSPNTSGRLKYIKKHFQKSELEKYNVYFFYINDLDFIGHKYGGNSIEYEKCLVEIFRLINEIILYSKKMENEIKYIIFGDHGMVDVKKHINIKAILNLLPIKVKKDYIYFLDSTMARFWFFNTKSRNIIYDALSNIEEGKWIDEKEKEQYNIKYKHNKFGDAIWWANGGIVISPNFWQCDKILKGMHGYRKDVIENHTTVITNMYLQETQMNIMDMIKLNSILRKFLLA